MSAALERRLKERAAQQYAKWSREAAVAIRNSNWDAEEACATAAVLEHRADMLEQSANFSFRGMGVELPATITRRPQ